MAKSKKSKILASMLAVSTMAVFYAAPVMAGDLSVSLDGQGIVAEEKVGFLTEEHPVTGTLTIGEDKLTTALSGTDLTLNSVTANTISNSAGSFIVDNNGDIIANSLVTSGDVVAGTASLKTVDERTQNMTATAGVTNFTGNVNVDGNVTAANGSFDRITLNGHRVLAADHVLTVGSETLNFRLANQTINNVAGIERIQNTDGSYKTVVNDRLYVDSITQKTGGFYITANGQASLSRGQVVVDYNGNINIDSKVENGGNIILQDGATVDGVDVSELSTTVEGNVTDLKDLNHKTQNINMEGTNEYTTAFDGNLIADGTIGNGRFMATNDGNVTGNNFKGNNFVTTSGADLNELDVTVEEIGKNTQSIKYNDGVTTIGGDTLAVTDEGLVTINNGTFTVSPEGYVNVGTDIEFDGVNGTVTANDLRANNNVYSKNYNLETVGAGLDAVGDSLEDLTGSVGNIGDNTAGIHRNDGDLPYGEGVTSIEGVVSVDGSTGLVNIGNVGDGTGILINSTTGQVIANSIGANSVVTKTLSAGNGALRVDENDDISMQNGQGESISMTDGGLNLTTVGNGNGMITLKDGTVRLTGNGTSTVTIDEAGTTFGTPNGKTNINDGKVTTSDDFVTVNADGTTKYTLNTIGDNTQSIKYNDGVTTIGGDTLAVTDDGYVTINNGAFAVGPDGMATVGNSIQLDGATGTVTVNDLRANNNVYSKNYNLETVGAELAGLQGDFDTTNANVAGIERTGSDEEGWTTTIEGATSFDANGMNVGNGAVVANTNGSFSAANGAFNVDTNGNVTANSLTVGETYIGSTSITTDIVYADEVQVGDSVYIGNGNVRAHNVFSDNYNLEEVGASLEDLTGDFATVNEDVAGIKRTGNAADGWTTTIEDYFSVSTNGTINLNGTVNFTGHDGNRYTLEDLEGRVSALEDKTQNITSSEPGQGGEGTVPPTTEGHTGVKGDVTVGGDLTVNGGITAGNSTIGGVGLVDGKVTANEGTFGKGTFGSGENQTVINDNGVTVGGENGTSIKHDEITVGDGGYIGGGDVVSGNDVSLNETANRVGNLEQGVADLNSRVNHLEDRIDKVGAMAAAIANLRTMGYDPAAPTEVAVGLGQYRDETGAALGLFHYPNRDFMLSLSVSTSGDEVMGGIGATWKFGRKSPEKVAEIKKAQAEADVRRAEEAKLAKAEEMKKAAKEAKIKAQQERHAKLAAERAAQAEAK